MRSCELLLGNGQDIGIGVSLNIGHCDVVEFTGAKDVFLTPTASVVTRQHYESTNLVFFSIPIHLGPFKDLSALMATFNMTYTIIP